MTEGQAINLGQHQIEKDQIRGVLQSQGLPFDAIICPLDIKTTVFQMGANKLAHVAIVFDQQDARLHWVSLREMERTSVRCDYINTCGILSKFVILCRFRCGDQGWLETD